MTDTPTPADHARTAVRSVHAVRVLSRSELVGSTADAYTLIDQLAPVVHELSLIFSDLANHFTEWAALADSHRRPRDLPDRLRRAASLLGMHAGNHAARTHQCIEDTLATLDRPRYRRERGIPLDWTPKR